MKTTYLSGLILPLLLSACGVPKNEEVPANNLVTPSPEVMAVEEDQDALAANDGGNGVSLVATWAGRWKGPEGLFLDIAPKAGEPGRYALTMKPDLDRQDRYTGIAKDEGIVFSRNGQPFTIRAGSGDETGFKDLAGKQDCLIVVAGKEGYCRD